MQEANSEKMFSTKNSRHLDRIRQLIYDSVRKFREQGLSLDVHLKKDDDDDAVQAVDALFKETFDLFHEYQRQAGQCHKLERQDREREGQYRELIGQCRELEKKNQVLEANYDAEVERRMKDAHRRHTEALAYQVDEVARLRGVAGSLEVEKDNLVTEHTNAIEGLIHQHSEERELFVAQHEIDKDTLARDQQKLRDSELREKAKDQDILQMQQNFAVHKAQLETGHATKVADIESEFGTTKSLLEGNITKLTAKVAELQLQHNSDKEKIRKDFKDKIAEKEGVHKASLATLEASVKTERTRWETDRTNLQEKAKETQIKYDSEKEKMRGDFNTTVTSLKSAFDKERLRLERERVEQQAALKNDVEYLNGELLARDSYTPRTDHELKSPFQELNNKIDALSRLKWKFNQAEWPNDLLGRLSDNQRKVKKQLAQDIVWIILYEKILCSPFRVFGEEGQSLELQWNEAYGKGSHSEMERYIWPKPTLESERWRYRTTTRLQEAVKQPASKWDPNSELKNEYNRSLESITKELSETLGKISQLDQPIQQALEEIPKKVAEMWVEMATQRCRIVVVLPGSNLKSQLDRVKKAREGGFELVDMPGLWRFGNSKGQDLDKVEIISAAITIKLPLK